MKEPSPGRSKEVDSVHVQTSMTDSAFCPQSSVAVNHLLMKNSILKKEPRGSVFVSYWLSLEFGLSQWRCILWPGTLVNRPTKDRQVIHMAASQIPIAPEAWSLHSSLPCYAQLSSPTEVWRQTLPAPAVQREQRWYWEILLCHLCNQFSIYFHRNGNAKKSRMITLRCQLVVYWAPQESVTYWHIRAKQNLQLSGTKEWARNLCQIWKQFFPRFLTNK